jgi:hypothetical protein
MCIKNPRNKGDELIMQTVHKKHKVSKNIALNNSNLFIIGSVIVSLLLLLKFRSFFVFLIIGIIAGVINYFIHATKIHVHLGHVSFLAIVFSYTLGFKYGIFMIIIAHILPEILAGHLDMEMIISAGVYVLICFLASIFNQSPIVSLGITLSIIQAILTFVFEKMSGTPVMELITENGVELFMLVFYFLSFAKPLVSIII